MVKRILILAGIVAFGLSVVSGLIALSSETAPAVRAAPNLPADCTPVVFDIFTHTTWSDYCYRVMTSTVTIQPDVILTISPITSTRIEFESGAYLVVLGRLQALGEPSRPITFTSAFSTTPCSWSGIVLPFGSQGARIEHSTIEYACTGVTIGGVQSVQIVSNLFRYNGDGGSTGGAISGITDYSVITGNVIYNSTNGIVLNKAFSNQIVGNTIHDIQQYGINFTAQLTTGLPTVGGDNNMIANNSISNALVGLRLEIGSYNQVLSNSISMNPGGAAFLLNQDQAIVRYNRIYSNGEGLRLETGSSNQVLSNSIYLNTGSAIYLSGQGSPVVQSNHVFSNGGGADYRAAIYISGTPDLATTIVSYNTVHDERQDALEYTANNNGIGSWAWNNALCSVPSFDLRNDDDLTVDARYNWWGTNTPTSGQEYIGAINLSPWITLSLITTTAALPADGVSTSVITISLRDALGHTAPPASPHSTNPPAPNARRIGLATSLGVINPSVVVVDDNGFAVATLTSAPTVGTAIITATAFCNYPITIPVSFLATNLAITKTVAVTQVVAGDVLTYSITYSNTSGVTATDVRITDTLPAGAIWLGDNAAALGWVRIQTSPQVVYTRASLPPGARESFILTATVSSAACGASLINGVAIGAGMVEEDYADNTASAGPVQVICADVAIAKTTSVTQTVAGGLITYTIIYSNVGSATAYGVVITDVLPTGTQYVTDTSGLPCPACVPGSTGPLVWSVPAPIPPNSSFSFNLTLQVNLGTSDCNFVVPPNTVVITTTTPESNTSNNTAASPPVASVCPVDLVVLKDDDVGPTTPGGLAEKLSPFKLLEPQAVTQHRDFVYEGDLITYTIAVINNGTVTATNVILTETLPQYTSFVTGSGWVAVTPITYVLSVGSLPPGAGRVYYFVVWVDDPLPAGVSVLVNQVCGFAAESDGNPADNCAYEDTPVRRLVLRISKWAECIVPGQVFNYWIVYTNTMTTTTFYNVPITDTLPISTTYAGAPGDWTCSGNAYCAWIAPAIYPGVDVKPLPVRLDQNYPYATVTNTVVISDGPPFTLVSPVDQGVDLAVVKNDNIGPLPLAQQQAWEQVQRQLYGQARVVPMQNEREYAQPGEWITYTILYVNDGVMTATNVILTETLPAQTTYVGGGWTYAGGRFYTISLGTLAPHQGGALEFIVRVNDPFYCGSNWVINRVDMSGAGSECSLSNNWSVDQTPITGCTTIKVYLPIILRQEEQVIPTVQVAFSSANYRVLETRGVATITVVLNAPSAQTVTVDYFTADGTATAGQDYITATGTLTFPPGTTSRTFAVSILTDTLAESPETVILTLAQPVNAALGSPNPATLTIYDPCPPTPPDCAPAVWCVMPSEFSPMGMAYDSAAGHLFVANQGDALNVGNLTILDNSGAPVHVLDNLPGAQGVALDKSRNRAYVAGGNWLYVVDVSGTAPSVLTTIGLGEDVGAYSVAYNPNTDLIYVTGYNNDSVTVINAGSLSIARKLTGFFQPSYTAVNTATNKVYVSNHTGGVPWGFVSVLSGTTKLTTVHLSGDLYGISVDAVRNRIYVASISAARVYVIDGRTDTTMGDIQIVRARDARPVPLRQTAVNPSVGTDTHLWLTSSQGDLWGMDRLILLALPQSAWPPQAPFVLRAVAVDPSPEGGLVFDPNPASWRVFASSALSNLVTLSQDKAALCETPLYASASAQEDYRVVTHDYAFRRRNR